MFQKTKFELSVRRFVVVVFLYFFKERRHVANKLHCFRKKRSLPNVIEIRINAKAGMHSNVHCTPYTIQLYTEMNCMNMNTSTKYTLENIQNERESYFTYLILVFLFDSGIKYFAGCWFFFFLSSLLCLFTSLFILAYSFFFLLFTFLAYFFSFYSICLFVYFISGCRFECHSL